MWYKKVLSQNTVDSPSNTLIFRTFKEYPESLKMVKDELVDFINMKYKTEISPSDAQKAINQVRTTDVNNIGMESKLDSMGLHDSFSTNAHGVPQDLSPINIWQGIDVFKSDSNNIQNANLPSNKTFVGTTIGSGV